MRCLAPFFENAGFFVFSRAAAAHSVGEGRVFLRGGGACKKMFIQAKVKE